jgi:hypothetical protein
VINAAAVRADDVLIENLRAGGQPPVGDRLAAELAAWRDQTQK